MKVAIVDYGWETCISVEIGFRRRKGLVQAKCRGLSDFAA